MRALIAGSAILLLSGCEFRRSPPASSTAEAERLLRARVAEYYADMSARDWPAYREYFWPGATLATTWHGPSVANDVLIMTIEQFLAQTAEGPDSKPVFEERLLGQEVRLSGNLAQVWARYEARFGDSTAVGTWRGTDAFTWLKQGEEWRITSLTFASESGEPPAPR
jgi:hypothetical protein